MASRCILLLLTPDPAQAEQVHYLHFHPPKKDAVGKFHGSLSPIGQPRESPHYFKMAPKEFILVLCFRDLITPMINRHFAGSQGTATAPLPPQTHTESPQNSSNSVDSHPPAADCTVCSQPTAGLLLCCMAAAGGSAPVHGVQLAGSVGLHCKSCGEEQGWVWCVVQLAVGPAVWAQPVLRKFGFPKGAEELQGLF